MISPKGPGACTGLQFLEIAYSSKMAMAKIVNKDPLTQLFIQMGLTGLKEEEEEGGGVLGTETENSSITKFGIFPVFY